MPASLTYAVNTALSFLWIDSWQLPYPQAIYYQGHAYAGGKHVFLDLRMTQHILDGSTHPGRLTTLCCSWGAAGVPKLSSEQQLGSWGCSGPPAKQRSLVGTAVDQDPGQGVCVFTRVGCLFTYMQVSGAAVSHQRKLQIHTYTSCCIKSHAHKYLPVHG